jgi:hypothetical protein
VPNVDGQLRPCDPLTVLSNLIEVVQARVYSRSSSAPDKEFGSPTAVYSRALYVYT